jgi:hypothetical protein
MTETEKGIEWVSKIINEYSAAIRGSLDYLTHAIQCGTHLNAAKKEVGKRDWDEFCGKNFPQIGDRTLRNWMKWARPENAEKLKDAENWKRASKIAGSDGGLTWREINELLKKPPTQAQKIARENRKAEREAKREAEKPKTLEEQIGGLDVHGVINVLEDVFGLDFLSALGDELAKRKQENNLEIPPALDRRPEQQFQRRAIG